LAVGIGERHDNTTTRTMDTGLQPFHTHNCEGPGESVMGWLRGLTEFKEHGAASLLQPTMISLGVPPGGLMNVRRDHATVRRVFAGAMQQGDKG
jgi:hypothetical protein